MPKCASCAASATWIAKLAGCANSVSPIRELASSRRSSSISDQSAYRDSSRSVRSMLSVKTGNTSSSPRHIPHHCGPMPVQTKASFGGR